LTRRKVSDKSRFEPRFPLLYCDRSGENSIILCEREGKKFDSSRLVVIVVVEVDIVVVVVAAVVAHKRGTPTVTAED